MKSIQKGREIEEAGLAAVRNLLRCLPGAEIAAIDQIRQVGHDHQFDGLIRVNYGGVTRLLAVEVQPHGAPRFVVGSLVGYVDQLNLASKLVAIRVTCA